MRTAIAAIGVIALAFLIKDISKAEASRDYIMYKNVISTIQSECSAPNV